MYKKKSIFITFEGIEGSGKSYQAQRLYKNLKKRNISSILTREPGGTRSAEKIREVILKDYFHHEAKEKFNKYTDTLLYLASRNEHLENKIKPAIKSKKIIICDRFTDSTLAYQHYGLGVKKRFINYINKEIMGAIKPDYTFLMFLNVNKLKSRISNRKTINRYDKFKKSFYKRVQNGFLKICNKNKSKYMVINSSNKYEINQDIIFNRVKKLLK